MNNDELIRPETWPHIWFGRQWAGHTDARPWTLTEAELVRTWEALPRPDDQATPDDIKRAVCAVLGVSHMSSRKVDRALQLLRKEGLATCVGSPRRWQRV